MRIRHFKVIKYFEIPRMVNLITSYMHCQYVEFPYTGGEIYQSLTGNNCYTGGQIINSLIGRESVSLFIFSVTALFDV